VRTLKRKAFFDLDRTIIEEVSGVELARILTKLEENHNKWKEFWQDQELLKNKSIDYDYAILKLSECFAKGVRNTDTETVQYAVRRLKKRVKIRDDFPELYSWLVENGFEIFVLTASPIEVFNAVPDFQFSETFGLILEKNDKYTGRCILPMTTKAKKTIIDKRSQDASFSFGVSDSVFDIRAYEKLDIKFLLNGTSLQNENCINVSDFLHVKTILKSHLEKNKK